MTKEEYIDRLRQGLEGLPYEELESAVLYYQEYLEEAGVDIGRVLHELGEPELLAAQILANSQYRETRPVLWQPVYQKGNRGFWMVMLIVTSPVWVLLLAALLCVAAAVFFSIAMLAVITVVTSLVLAVGAVCLLFSGGVLLFTDLASGVFFLGVSMAFAGISIFMGSGAYALGRHVVPMLMAITQSVGRNISGFFGKMRRSEVV